MSIVTSATLFTSHCPVETLDRCEHLLWRLALRLSVWNQEVRQLELPSALAPIGIRYCGRNGGRLNVVPAPTERSEEHTSELQSLMRISYAVFCLKNKKQ